MLADTNTPSTRRPEPEPARSPATLDEAVVRRLFGEQIERENFRFDPEAVLVRAPGMHSVWSWAEHPRGEFRVCTNDLGFNEAEPTRRTAPDVRILVAGDSHTQAVVDVDESYANVLEALLRTADGKRSIDVLNAGVAYTGPRCYLGMLRRCLALELRPDVFVAAFFTGNDLQDELRLEDALGRVVQPEVPADYWEPLQTVGAKAPGPVAQGFNQLYRYRHFPAEAEAALELVIEAYEDMQELCEAHGILLVALVLPTKMDADPEDDRELIRWCQRELRLSDDQMGANRAAAGRFGAAMQERGILCIDPTDAMRSSSAPCYWRRDYHLNVSGHRLVAELLNEALAGRL